MSNLSQAHNPKKGPLSWLPWLQMFPLLKPKDYILTVDHRTIWRRHLAWAKPTGKVLREHMTQRYASNLAFMSLILSGEMGVLFSPSDVCTSMRKALKAADHGDLEFWIGIFLVVSMFLTFMTLIATFTAWAVISSISDNNARAVLRSSIGLHASGLPSRTLVLALYTCLIWMILFMIQLVPFISGIIITILAVIYLLHIIYVYSSLGKMIMYTGAMGPKRIFEENVEVEMLPWDLNDALAKEAKKRRENKIRVSLHYPQGQSAV